MREYLFRGKSLNNNEWLYGDYCAVYLLPRIGYEDKSGTIHRDCVKSETVGQFTGLLDVHGKRIYEGDIIEDRKKYTSKDEDIFRRYEVKYSTEWARFIAVLPNGVFNPAAFQNCEIIGNIHDNPELIGGTGND